MLCRGVVVARRRLRLRDLVASLVGWHRLWKTAQYCLLGDPTRGRGGGGSSCPHVQLKSVTLDFVDLLSPAVLGHALIHPRQDPAVPVVKRVHRVTGLDPPCHGESRPVKLRDVVTAQVYGGDGCETAVWVRALHVQGAVDPRPWLHVEPEGLPSSGLVLLVLLESPRSQLGRIFIGCAGPLRIFLR